MGSSLNAGPRGLALIDGTMPAWAERADRAAAIAFIDSCLRGVGQVCFMNNPVIGLAILVAMFVADPWLGFAGALGLAVSTASPVRQVITDPEGHHDWAILATVDLDASDAAGEPVIRTRAFRSGNSSIPSV